MNITLRVKIKDLDSSFQVAQVGTKELYAPNVLASHWAREGVKGLKTIDVPQLCSAVNVANCKTLRGTATQNSFGYMNNSGNNVYENTTRVGLYSSTCNNGNGFPVLPVNFDKAIALFTARKTIDCTWINCKDEYMPPNIDHPDYQQWNTDALVYALFHNGSQQSSLRDITYKGKQWDVQNEWFWMSNDEMRSLADVNTFNELYSDAKRFNKDRFVFKRLGEITLSPDAQNILDMASDLVRISFSTREAWHDESPEQHLDAWDAGWAQLKPMLKKHYKASYNEFVTKYKEFEARMREGVYKFGFLRQ